MADDWTVARALDFLADYFQGVASGAADDGAAPLKIGGVYRTVLPTLADGQRADVQLDNRGHLLARLGANGTFMVIQGAGTDDNPNSNAALVALAESYLYNPTNVAWDRERANHSVFPIPPAARIASIQSATLTNHSCRGLHITLDVTAITATPSITLTVQGRDELSGRWYDILVGAAVTTVSTNVYKLYPGITPVANVAVSDVLPRVWRVVITHGDADSITYSVGTTVIR